MTPTKILFGQILISLSLALLMIWWATQWTAGQFGYADRLGLPWFEIFRLPVYYPWEFFIWWVHFEAAAPLVFLKGAAIAASGGLAGVAAAIVGSVLRARQPKEVTTYGSANWASKKDIRNSGLLSNEGVILGQWGKHYLRHDGEEHVMAFAPTRSGKGVGLVVPTLLSWTGSAIIHDLKGENWQLTAGWRAKFSRCYRFDPTDLASAKFNPLMEIRKGIHELQDTQNIVDILIDPNGSKPERNHWDKTSYDLLTAAVLHVLYAEEDKTLHGVARFLSNPECSAEEMLEAMRTTNHLGDRPHDIVAMGARQAQNMSPNEFSGVLSTAMTTLSHFRDPILSTVTSSSDFSIDDIAINADNISLYLVAPPSDDGRIRPLIRMVLNQVLRRLTEKHDAEKPHDLLLMLDEFPSLGRLDFFESALSFIGGYGIKAYLIAQSLNQIEKAYGPNNAILDNCHLRIAFATNDERTAKRISDALGATTEQRHQRNYAGHRLAPWLGHMMVSTQETQRQLLTPGELMQLPSDEAIIMVGGKKPIRAKKVRYFKDRNFVSRRCKPPVSAASSSAVCAGAGSGNRWQGTNAGIVDQERAREIGQDTIVAQEPAQQQQGRERTREIVAYDAMTSKFLSRFDGDDLPDLGGSLD
ncbi:IncP-type conjugal transfer protein TraG [Parvularcula sp. IMCC14364]|uniref:IncP-type conjugal transfer protein TraG n=1 Tax=Parvularcula sp. IMCC14364 TaxID=3067902 RepID=UPI002740822F|nr:IncP-type conjugal transfer protein TraG [Parvularcula sp. IMCC14364]